MFNLFLGRSAGGATTAYTLSCESGSVAVTGTDASLIADRRLTLASGTYTVAGTAASLEAGYVLFAGNGAFTVTGTDATLEYVQRANRPSGGGGGVRIHYKYRPEQLRLKKRKPVPLNEETLPKVAREAESHLSAEEAAIIYMMFY